MPKDDSLPPPPPLRPENRPTAGLLVALNRESTEPVHWIITQMCHAARVVLSAVILVSVAGGCAIPGIFMIRTMDYRYETRFNESALESLQRRLRQDRWQSVEVTPAGQEVRQAKGADSSDRDSQWRYGDPLLQAVLFRLDQESGQHHAIEWSIFSDGTGPDAWVSRSAVDHLEKLADDDGIVGWNAAILLAYREPHVAKRFVPLLRKLSSQRMYYERCSGRAVEIEHSTNASERKERGRSREAAAFHEKPLPALLKLMRDEGECCSTANSSRSALSRMLGNVGLLRVPKTTMPKDVIPVSPAMQGAAREALARVIEASE